MQKQTIKTKFLGTNSAKQKNSKLSQFLEAGDGKYTEVNIAYKQTEAVLARDIPENNLGPKLAGQVKRPCLSAKIE